MIIKMITIERVKLENIDDYKLTKYNRRKGYNS